jgi:hypothetical protein
MRWPGTYCPVVVDEPIRAEVNAALGATPLRSLRTAALLTAAVGALHAVLFLCSYWLLSGRPGPTASVAQLTAFYTSARKRRVLLAGLYLMPFAGIAFIWFVVALRMWVEGTTQRINVLLSNVQLVTGILYVGLFFAAAASTSVLAASVEYSNGAIDPVVAHEFPQFGSTLLLVFALRMAAMFVFTTSTIARAAHVVPRWFCWSGYAVGVFLLLSASLEPWLALIFPIWLLVLSALLLQRARHISPERRLPVGVPR